MQAAAPTHSHSLGHEQLLPNCNNGKEIRTVEARQHPAANGNLLKKGLIILTS